MSEEKIDRRPELRRRKGRSMLGPVILITAGILLLLSNLGLLPDLNWAAAFRLWPMLLIALGLNIIVRQVPRPAGTILSLLVSLGTVAIFGAVLLLADDQPALRRLSEANLESQRVTIPRQDVARARLHVDAGSQRLRLYELEDSASLLEGLLPGGERQLDWSVENDTAVIRLDADNLGSLDFFTMLDPANWDGDDRRVDLAVDGRLPLDLRVDVGSGPIEMDLSGLTLTKLFVDGGSGPVGLRLPGGDYELELDVGSGPVVLQLVEVGQITMRIEGGSGPLTVALPPGAPIQLEVVDGGSGPLTIDYTGLDLVRGDSDDEGLWETATFTETDKSIILEIDARSGPIRVSEAES